MPGIALAPYVCRRLGFALTLVFIPFLSIVFENTLIGPLGARGHSLAFMIYLSWVPYVLVFCLAAWIIARRSRLREASA
jgi:hypothetical protein